MRLGEFIDKYCKDIVERKQAQKAFTDDNLNLPYDRIIEDIDGTRIKVIDVEEYEPIPLSDVIYLDKADFYKKYINPAQRQAYDNYMDAIELIEGADVLEIIRKRVSLEKATIDEYKAERGGLQL